MTFGRHFQNRMFKTGFAAILSVWFLVNPAVGATIIEIPTSFGFGADTHINFGSGSNNNNGASVANGVQEAFAGSNTTNTDSAFTARPFLRFDLGGLPNGVITDAHITFAARFVTNRNITVEMLGLQDGHAQDAAPGSGGWDELTLTRNNAPASTAFTTTVGREQLHTEIPLTAGDPAPTFVTFSASAGTFKDDLIDFLNADTNGFVTMMMVSQNPSLAPLPSFSFWSKEGEASGETAAVAPTLSITIETAVAMPEAATAIILAFGVFAIGAFRRRR